MKRRQFTGFAALLMSLVLLSACAAGNAAPEQPSTAGQETSAASESQQAPDTTEASEASQEVTEASEAEEAEGEMEAIRSLDRNEKHDWY